MLLSGIQKVDWTPIRTFGGDIFRITYRYMFRYPVSLLLVNSKFNIGTS